MPNRRAHDVIVVGLGGMGSAAVYHLARRGQRVLGLDRFSPAHDRGSLLLITGGLLLGSPGCTMLTGAQAAASAWDVDDELLSAAEIRRRFPTLAPGPDTVAFFEPTAGLVHPETAGVTGGPRKKQL